MEACILNDLEVANDVIKKNKPTVGWMNEQVEMEQVDIS